MFKIRRFSTLALFAGLIFSALLNTGTVRKKNDPILKTQTDPIKLKDKLEEVKDGEKGPATPVFSWYGGGNKFMIHPPFDQEKAKEAPAEPANKVSEVDVAEKAEEVAEDKEPESLAPKADTAEDAAPPKTKKKGKSKKSGKGSKWEKDWWDEI